MEKKIGTLEIIGEVDLNGDITLKVAVNDISTKNVTKIIFSTIAHLNQTLKGFASEDDVQHLTEDEYNNKKQE